MNTDLPAVQTLGANCLYSTTPRKLFTDQWKRLTSGSVCIPALILAQLNAYNLWNEHWEHWEHLPPLEERTEYAYQNIRTKNFFWGDGDKVNNPTPNGPMLLGKG